MPHVDPLDHLDHGFSDVLRVIADALDRLGDEHDLERRADRARIFHHVADQLPQDRRKRRVDALVAVDHLGGGARVEPREYVERAASIIAEDEEIDAAFSAILRQLISYMMEDPRTISPALEIIFMAKSIERIGDHAKNIAEAVVQVVKGIDVRHATAEQIRAEVAEE